MTTDWDEVRRQLRAAGCDAANPSVYAEGDPAGGPITYVCRCGICGRCGRHTGNATQRHYWARCKVTKTMRDFHFCCPGNCELEEVAGDGGSS